MPTIDELIPKKNLTLEERISDIIAEFGGSWKFIIIFTVTIGIWILINSTFMNFDPFPFILLNLFLSLTAAFQAPIIMMSQNRQELRERMKTEKDLLIDYQSI